MEVKITVTPGNLKHCFRRNRKELGECPIARDGMATLIATTSRARFQLVGFSGKSHRA
jgi:hypothetical protein